MHSGSAHQVENRVLLSSSQSKGPLHLSAPSIIKMVLLFATSPHSFINTSPDVSEEPLHFNLANMDHGNPYYM